MSHAQLITSPRFKRKIAKYNGQWSGFVNIWFLLVWCLILKKRLGVTPTSKVTWKVEAFSLCMVFTFLQFSREVPHGTKGTSPRFVTRPMYSRSQLQEQHKHSLSVLSLPMHLFHALYTWYAGIAHHRALQTSGRGWADSKAVHGMECSGGVHALLEVSLSRGCCLTCTVLLVQEGVLTHTTEC